MPRGRSLVRMLLLAVAVGFGLIVGLLLVAQRGGRDEHDPEAPALDLSIRDAAPAELAKRGFRLTGREPASWNAISMRLYQDQRGSVALMRCSVDPGEAGTLVDMPAGSHRPLHDEPPADWPWGGESDPFRVPGWWQPRGTQSRCWEHRDADGWASGCFVGYDPAARLLHAWRWRRNDRPASSDRGAASSVVDDLIQSLFVSDAHSAELRAAQPDRWLEVEVPAALSGLAVGRLPDSVLGIAAVARLDPGAQCWLLEIMDLDEAAAWALIGEMPMWPLPDDGPVPVARWRFALAPTPDSEGKLPAWFTPGPGPRRAHCLLAIGSGAVEAGRWAAYDRARRRLYVWSWTGPEQPASADLCTVPP